MAAKQTLPASPRFKAKTGAFALLTNKLGPVIDIGPKGLTFEYIDDGKEAREPVEIEIFSKANDFYLPKVPVQSVKELDMQNEIAFSVLPVKQLYVQFGNMTPAQEAMLEYFLTHQTEGFQKPERSTPDG